MSRRPALPPVGERHFRKAKVVVTSGADAGLEMEISKARFSGGRSLINDLVLADKSVSGTHFELVSRDDGVCLRDLDSTNGTFVDELRVKEVYIEPGVTFRVGHTELRFATTSDTVAIPLSAEDRFDRLIGASVPMREIFALLEKVAPSDLTALIGGETGTGKEMVARAIHNASPRREKPFVVLDCSAIPRDLMESTVFGHEKGSFTGAIGQHKGLFEQAQGGTLFLDEIGELDMALQPKLLRVLENRELKRVGGADTLRTDVRIVAATNRDLRRMVGEGSFREDLYFRLSVIQLELPPLRDRREDIAALVKVFLRELKERWGKHLVISPQALQALTAHHWPGNVRELRNVIERAASLAEGPAIERKDLQFREAQRQRAVPPSTGNAHELVPGLEFKEAKQRVVDAFEAAYLADLLKRHAGNISGSAREAGITRFHLRELLKRHGLAPQRDPPASSNNR